MRINEIFHTTNFVNNSQNFGEIRYMKYYEEMASLSSRSSSLSSKSSKKKRRAITNAEKKLIRDFYNKDPNNKPSLKAIKAWFEETHYHTVSSSSISEILSDRYSHLDDTADLIFPERKRQRQSRWPDLEDALNEWQIRMVRKGTTITGLSLQEMAGVIWNRLPQYRDQEKPHFSQGWLDGFKKRYGIKQVCLL
jgi:hypothetical protein